jgi:hypothetical protein
MTTNDKSEERQTRQFISHVLKTEAAKCGRTCVERTPLSSRATICAYFRELRAVEMAVWELTGGDYMLSRFAAQN